MNNTIPMTAENVVIKPSSWDNMPEAQKEGFGMLFFGITDIMASEGTSYDRLEAPSFDLFSL